jgi:outer membrane protein TolC
LESLLRRLNYARQRMTASQETVAQAERAYNIAMVAYSAGTGTQYQINDVDVARAIARLNRLNAIYDYRVARAELDALLGRTVALRSGTVELLPTIQ